MALVSSAAGWFRAKVRAWADAGLAPQPQPPSGQRAPCLRCQAGFSGSLGSCPWNWTLSLPPGRPLVFPWTTPPVRPHTPANAECPGNN